MADLASEMTKLTKAIERANSLAAKQSVGTGSGGIAARARGGGGFGGGGGRGGRGGRGGNVKLGGALGMINRAAGTLLKAGTAPFEALGAGAVSSARGGSFQGGASRSLISAAGSVPFLGEAFGFKRVGNILDSGEADVNAATNQVAKFAGAGAITPKVREFLADRAVVQNRNLQDDKEKNRALFNDPKRQKAAAQGEDAPLKMLAIMDEIKNIISAIAGGLPGGTS